MTIPVAVRRVFKICSASEWLAATKSGKFLGSADDLRDGYIHLSTAEQAVETARKYFSHRDDLLLIEFDAAQFGAQLRWEPSRGGALFPHLYDPLPTTLARGSTPLQLSHNGTPDVVTALTELTRLNPEGIF
jgi:uncharacterized protein (DUF952 family)